MIFGSKHFLGFLLVCACVVVVSALFLVQSPTIEGRSIEPQLAPATTSPHKETAVSVSTASSHPSEKSPISDNSRNLELRLLELQEEMSALRNQISAMAAAQSRQEVLLRNLAVRSTGWDVEALTVKQWEQKRRSRSAEIDQQSAERDKWRAQAVELARRFGLDPQIVAEAEKDRTRKISDGGKYADLDWALNMLKKYRYRVEDLQKQAMSDLNAIPLQE